MLGSGIYDQMVCMVYPLWWRKTYTNIIHPFLTFLLIRMSIIDWQQGNVIVCLTGIGIWDLNSYKATPGFCLMLLFCHRPQILYWLPVELDGMFSPLKDALFYTNTHTCTLYFNQKTRLQSVWFDLVFESFNDLFNY